MAKIYLNDMPFSQPNDIIGVFGGSFNPPHEGHLLVARYAMKYLGLTRLWWMVSPGNPLKDNSFLPQIEYRIKLCENLLQNENYIDITGFEYSIKAFTSFDTIAYILNHKKTERFIWVMGGDSLLNFHHWYKWKDIAKMLPIAIVNRPIALNPHINSVFAKKYINNLIPKAEIYNLAFKKPPAWCYLQGNVSYLSSTQLRKIK